MKSREFRIGTKVSVVYDRFTNEVEVGQCGRVYAGSTSESWIHVKLDNGRTVIQPKIRFEILEY